MSVNNLTLRMLAFVRLWQQVYAFTSWIPTDP